MSVRAFLATLAATLRRLGHDRRGNVLMLMGFSVVPLTLATGIAIDYSHAAQLQTRMNAAADAAALAAVSKPMSQELNATVLTMATNVFNAQVSALKGLIYDPAKLTVTITGGVGANNTRTAVVSYTANSKNSFAGVIGMSSIAIGGASTATSSQAPNIDFYLMLDTSPSMLLPATTAGLASLTTATGGCAFACHQTNTTYSKGVKNVADNTELVCSGRSNTNCIDYYKVARNNSLILRTDLVTEAVQNLTDVATATAKDNGAQYRMGISDFDYIYRKMYPTTATAGYYVDSNLTNVKNHAVDAVPLQYCINNQRICGTGDNDVGTNFTAAFTGALATLPTAPGEGTNTSGDTPEAILFLITDGMRDEDSGGRKMGPIPTAQCDTIKARGIRIAVLHTEYLPASASDQWSIDNVKTPFLTPTDTISPALIACASPGLYYEVTTDSDISAALAALFAKAVSTAHLTK